MNPSKQIKKNTNKTQENAADCLSPDRCKWKRIFHHPFSTDGGEERSSLPLQWTGQRQSIDADGSIRKLVAESKLLL